MTSEKINVALVEIWQANLKQTLEDLENIWDQFERLPKNSPQRGQLFSAIIALLIQAESKFKRQNMYFFHLKKLLDFLLTISRRPLNPNERLRRNPPFQRSLREFIKLFFGDVSVRFRGADVFSKCERNQLAELIVDYYYPRVTFAGGVLLNTRKEFDFTKSMSIRDMGEDVETLEKWINGRIRIRTRAGICIHTIPLSFKNEL